ncbi:hypothetical protein D910_01859 [Dendroctonus ponderosae]|uniref:Uncharacterized protein n=1 Tax=Dendroctonus ponderosae TaxID=77166 RepID=U4TUJ0_DENPD|nr:hypothetical protein D910_01859 [Dendroctonus ponderosae]
MRGIMLSLALCLVPFFGLSESLTYRLDPESEALFTVSDNFLSVAYDTWLLYAADFSNPQFLQLVKLLSPMYFRIGGTTADIVIFVDDSNTEQVHIRDDDVIILTASYWLELTEFAKKAGVRILFDLNSLTRNEDGSWNSENAEQLIRFSRENDIDLDWELGNEPDIYYLTFNTSVSANQLAQDYNKLRALLDQYEYDSSYVVGPSMFDVGNGEGTKAYLREFLSGASSSIYAVSWHQYYFSGLTATEADFLNTDYFNFLEERTKVVTGIVGSSNKVWLAETSSCNNRGAEGKSDRFLASFLWLDKLGLTAKLGVDLLVRQTIWGYNYPLLNNEYGPNSDWWISILHKKVVGSTVIPLTNDGEDSRPVRLYAQCAKSDSLWGDEAVVVFGLNLADSPQTFTLSGIGASDVDVSIGYLFELTPETDLYSKYVGQKNYKDLKDMLYQGSILFLDANQKASGADLGLLLIDVLIKSEDKSTEIWCRKLSTLFAKIGTTYATERDSFLVQAVKWSSLGSSRGDPALHQYIAKVYWDELNYNQARHHYIHSQDGKNCAKLLIEFQMTKGFKCEIDLFVAQAVLQFLCLRNQITASQTFTTYTENHPTIKKTEPPYLLPLLNFLWFLLQALETKKLQTFAVLCEQYQKSLERDPCYLQYLDKIGQLFFGLKPPQPKKSGGLFGSLIDNFLEGLEDGSDDDDESARGNPAPSTSRQLLESADLD